MKRSAIKFIRAMEGNMKALVIGVFSLLVSNFALADQLLTGLTITTLSSWRYHNDPTNDGTVIYVFYSGGSAAFANGSAACEYPDSAVLANNDAIGYNEMLRFLKVALVTGRKVDIEIDQDACAVYVGGVYKYHQIQAVSLY